MDRDEENGKEEEIEVEVVLKPHKTSSKEKEAESSKKEKKEKKHKKEKKDKKQKKEKQETSVRIASFLFIFQTKKTASESVKSEKPAKKRKLGSGKNGCAAGSNIR